MLKVREQLEKVMPASKAMEYLQKRIAERKQAWMKKLEVGRAASA